MTHNHIAVIGRVSGDDEDSCLLFEHMTVPQARQAFIEQMRADAGITEEDVVEDCYSTEVYITHVLTSTSPMELT